MSMLASLHGVSCGHLQGRPSGRPASSIGSLSSAFSGCSLRQPSVARQLQRANRLQTCARQAGAEEDDSGEGAARRGRRGAGQGRSGDDRRGGGGDRRRGDQQQQEDEWQERVVQVRRVTKVVKGGKQLSFRAVVVVGDGKGNVGVGCAAAKEIAQSVQRAVLVAKREAVSFPLNKAFSLPHRIDGYWGAAKVMLRPAADGAGVIAGGAVRVVLELAGVRNCFGKQLGSANPLNNARATIEGLRALRTFKQVSKERGISVAELMGTDVREPETTPSNAIAGAMSGAI